MSCLWFFLHSCMIRGKWKWTLVSPEPRIDIAHAWSLCTVDCSIDFCIFVVTLLLEGACVKAVDGEWGLRHGTQTPCKTFVGLSTALAIVLRVSHILYASRYIHQPITKRIQSPDIYWLCNALCHALSLHLAIDILFFNLRIYRSVP